jgi:GntR family transcriptional repressor for pyruvate dehydrogenase complex
MTLDPAPNFRALDQRRAFEHIILQIEEAIHSGALRPGDKLPSERELAETFGVSRASVREALRVLERFGVLAAKVGNGPNSGSTIADSAGIGMTNALRLHTAVMRIPTKDTVDVRVQLEMHAVRRACVSASEDDHTRIRNSLEAMVAAGTPEEFHAHDTEFHVALARASGNELLPVLMESLRGAMQRDMLAGYARQGDWEPLRKELLQQHNDIFDAVLAGKEDAAAELIKHHIQHFYAHALVAE